MDVVFNCPEIDKKFITDSLNFLTPMKSLIRKTFLYIYKINIYLFRKIFLFYFRINQNSY